MMLSSTYRRKYCSISSVIVILAECRSRSQHSASQVKQFRDDTKIQLTLRFSEAFFCMVVVDTSGDSGVLAILLGALEAIVTILM